jgi:hypothetical protein
MKRHYLKGLVFLTAFLLASMTFSACFTPPKTFKMFGSLDEFSCFDSYEPEDIPDRSNLVKDLEIQERRCFKVNYKGTNFEVFAYVFGSDEDAETFSRRFREEKNSPLFHYNTYYITCYENKGLLYTGGVLSAIRANDFEQYLFDNLSIQIDPFAIDSYDQNSD